MGDYARLALDELADANASHDIRVQANSIAAAQVYALLDLAAAIREPSR